MTSLVYAPEVTVRIMTTGSPKPRIIDVSEDIQNGSVTRVINGISVANVQLLNQGRKYDGMFSPMDSIVVYLRRLDKPMLVFSGYLDSAPLFAALPGSIRIKASCTLKRLQHFMWDPGSSAAQALFESSQGTYREDLNDGGMAIRTVELLHTVAKWPTTQIHIAGVPSGWFDRIASLAESMAEESATLSASGQSVVGSGAYLAGGAGGATSSGYSSYTSVEGIGPGTGELPNRTVGKISWFGGPKGGAYGNMALSGESGTNPRDDWYCAMRWPYVNDHLGTISGVNVSKAKQWWSGQRIVVTNSQTGKAVICRAADWGPNISTGRIIDVSPAALKALGASTDDVVSVAFADKGTKSAVLGPIKGVSSGTSLPSVPTAGDSSTVSSGWGNHGDRSNMVSVTVGGLTFTVHKQAAQKFKGFVTDLIHELGYQPTSIGGFSDRPIAGTSRWSNHAYGAAIDIDPAKNPRYGTSAGGPYALPGPPKIIQLARKWGLYWGGEYNNSKDYMHFEVIGAPQTPAVPGFAGGTGVIAPTKKWFPPVTGYRVSAHFGDGGSLWSDRHTGTDFAVSTGTPIHPVGAGVVQNKGTGDAAYGNWICVDHGSGVYTFYAHMESASTLTVGDPVTVDSILGKVGMTGNVTGPHVHLELRLDNPASSSAAVSIEKYVLGGSGRLDPPRGVSGGVDETITSVGSATGTGSDLSNIGGALFSVFQWYESAADEGGMLLSGYRALMNDKPILNTVSEYMAAALRHYCSAPNGDFIGWFPDYFGEWGQAGKMVISPLEIDGESSPPTISWDDTNLKTHQFVTSATTGISNDASSLLRAYTTAGIASVEFPEILHALLNISKAEAKKMSTFYLNRMGARPDWTPLDNITSPEAEFYFACHKFMENWSQQYQAEINLIFMPELYPGMLACFPIYGIQGYVREVTHSWDLTDGGSGFTTSFSAAPWSSMGKDGPKGMPRGASL